MLLEIFDGIHQKHVFYKAKYINSYYRSNNSILNLISFENEPLLLHEAKGTFM